MIEDLRNIAKMAENLNEESLEIEKNKSETKPKKEVKTSKPKLSFVDRSKTMGLKEFLTGVYEYKDRFSKVSYRQLYTSYDEMVPILAVYTGKPDNDDYKYVGYISDSYEFVGNDNVVNKIKDSINEAGITTKIEEYPIMDLSYVQLHNELVISNGQNIPKVGDIYPQIVVSNSYNGTKAVDIAFGLSVSDRVTPQRWGFAFRTKLGTMRQVHMKSSSSTLRSSIGNYVKTFQSNINDVIEANFTKSFTESDIANTLKLIEKLGTKKKDEITKLISDLTGTGKTSFWDMFNLIVKFSASQKNINAKVYLESVAERVLVIPSGMFELLVK